MKNKLYPGESSDEEEGIYSKEKIVINTNKLNQENAGTKISFLSSFILEEISHSILEDRNVLDTYSKKKSELATNFKDLLKNNDSIDQFLFGQRLVHKHNSDSQWLNQFYNKNTEKIKAFKNKIEILDKLHGLKRELTEECQIKDFDFQEVQVVFTKYFPESDISTEVESYFQNQSYSKIKQIILKKNSSELIFSTIGKRGFRNKNYEAIQNFFEETFLSEYYHKLLETKIKDKNQNSFKEFLTGLDLNDYNKSLIKIYTHNKSLLFQLLTNKKLKVSEELLSSEDRFITELYISFNIDNLNTNQNKKINQTLLKKLPLSYYLEEDNTPEEFFANFKLAHRIIRSKIKEVGIDNYRDASISHNIFISDFTVNADIEISKGGTRTDYRKLPLKGQSTAYSNLINNELNIKLDTGKLFKLIILKILKEKEITDQEINNLLVDDRDKEFLYKFADLLFSCEPERNASAFLTNAMFFDLVASNRYSLNDLPSKLPMAIKKDENKSSGPGAVAGARYILNLLGGEYGEQSPYLTKRQYYDFGNADENKGYELAVRDTVIFLDWLIIKNILDEKDQVKYNDYNKSEQIINLDEVGNRIHSFYDTLTRQPNNMYAKNTLLVIAESINHYLADAISRQKSDQIFKALYDLVYEWYGVTLKYLLVAPTALEAPTNQQLSPHQKQKNLTESNLITIQPNQVINALNSIEIIILDELLPKLSQGLNNWEKGWYTDTMQQLLLRSYNQNCVVHEKINTTEIIKISGLINLFTEANLFKDITGTLEQKTSRIRKTLLKKFSFLNYEDLKGLTQSEFSRIPDQDIQAIEELVQSIKVTSTTSKFIYPSYIQEQDKQKFDVIYKLKNSIYGSLKDTSLFNEIKEFLQGQNNQHMIIPINVNDTHWAAFVINKQDKKIFYIDTMAGRTISNYALDIILQEIMEALEVENDVTYIFDKPVQYDGYNCGPFMIEAVSRVVRGKDLQDFKKTKNNESSISLGERIRTVHQSLLKSSEVNDHFKTIQSLDTNTVSNITTTKTAENLLAKGYALDIKHQYQQAIEYYNRLIEKNPQCLWAYHNKGISSLHEAIKCFDKVLELITPTNADRPIYTKLNMRYNKGLALYELCKEIENPEEKKQKYREAIKCFEAVIVNANPKNRDYKDAIDSKTLCIMKLNNLDRALHAKFNKDQNTNITLSGLNKQSEVEKKDICGLHPHFGKYTLDGIDNILNLRLKDLQLEGVKILQGTFINQDCNNIFNALTKISNFIDKTVLVPLNLFNEHAVGLVFIKTAEEDKDNTIQVKYIDSLNKPIPQELKQLIVSSLGSDINFEEITVEKQKYANCGSEVIENFILYLTGTRLDQEQAIELHSKLVENTLLNNNILDMHLLFNQQCNTYESIFTNSEQLEPNLSYINDQADLLGVQIKT